MSASNFKRWSWALLFGIFLLNPLATSHIYAQAAVSFVSGAFTNDTVLALVGPASQEVYAVSLGDATARTTTNGYTFQADSSSNISYSVSGTYSSFLSGGGTTGDSNMDAILSDGRVGSGNGTLTLSNLVAGVQYEVLFLLADTRTAENGRQFSITSGTNVSPTQVYAFAAGTPSIGGYVLGAFTATGPTQTFTNNNSFGYQLNGILVCFQPTISFASGVFSNDAVLSLAGSPGQEVYGVSFGDSNAQTTGNGYAFQVDGSSNASYNVSGTYTGFLSGGGTTGDAAFDTVLSDGRVGTGTGVLTLSNLVAGTEYQILFLLADTRSAEGGRQFSITSGAFTSPSQTYAFAGGTPSIGAYVIGTFTATATTQTFTNNNAYGYQLNAILVWHIGVGQVKANNNDALQSGTSWISGTAPDAVQNAVWNATISTPTNCINTLGGASTWGGIVIDNPSAPVEINGNTTLIISNGINMSGATENFTLNCGTVSVPSNQIWSVAPGLALSTGSSSNAGSVNGGNNTVTLSGGGTWVVSGTGDNNGLGIIVNFGTLDLNKISSSGDHAVGSPGLIINSDGTAIITGTGGDQIYNGASVTASGTFDLNGNTETIASLSFSGGTLQDSSGGGKLMDSGNLALNGNVTVNMPYPAVGTNVILTYGGTRSGTGSFIAGNLPSGAVVADNTSAQTVSVIFAGPPVAKLIIPTLNTNESVVASATPQQYGVTGDGITDDSAAFQAAINAVYHSGTFGGGVVYVPAGNYAFYTNITVPTGVTLHGDWTDWTTSGGPLVGTTFKVYFGAGQTNAQAFLTLQPSAALRDINIWYPNQNPTNITGYPFSITLGDSSVIQNVVLVNSYQGAEAGTLAADGLNGAAHSIVSSIIGSPLFLGFAGDQYYDIAYFQDVRFSPAIWAESGLSNAPAVGGTYATWMRSNGTGMRIYHIDGDYTDIAISGYNKGLDFEATTNGSGTAPIYEGFVTNCAIAVNAQVANLSPAVEFSDFTIEGDTAINRTITTNDVNFQFSHCTITGGSGTAVNFNGNSWQSVMAFQSCAINGQMNLTGPGIFNLVDCGLNASTQCVMAASATRAAFAGCVFTPSQNIVNQGSVSNLIVDSRQSISNAMPTIHWTNFMNNFAMRQPAKQTFFNVLNYGAEINTTNDSTVAIQNALNAAGTNGGGIVYLPAGQYNTTNTLTVPSGVELRGAYEMRHSTEESLDRQEKGSILQPTGGQGTTNGPVAIVLQTNAGLRGLTIYYPTQTSNCIPFPATIQGQGPNVYAIGLQCPDPYFYVDFDTYNCTNHLLDMVDGWALETGCKIGNGSSGSIVNCHGNFSFWRTYWPDAGKGLPGAGEPAVESFGKHNLQYYALGNCTESFVANFSIEENMFMHGVSESNIGPNITSINTMCDSTYQPFVFGGSGPSTVNIVNPNWLVVVSGYSDLTNATALTTATNYQGTIRLFNSPLCGGTPINDYVIGGGDVGAELVHLYQYANSGIYVNGGVFHLINCGTIDKVSGPSGTFNLTLGPSAGLTGKTNEFIGNFAWNGYTFTNLNASNSANVWVDYAVSNYVVLDMLVHAKTVVTQPSNLPPLAVQFDASKQMFTLQWADNGKGLAAQPGLYYAANLTPPITWMLLTNEPVISGGMWSVTLPKSTNAANFFELQ